MLDVVIVGAGQAGLAMSRQLVMMGIEHVALEGDRVGSAWRSQRWDSFQLNTPGWYSGLPGDPSGPGPSDGFAARDEVVAYFEAYMRRHRLPVREGVAVTAVEASTATTARGFTVRGTGLEPLAARVVVVAAGGQRVARLPPFAADLPDRVSQLHSVAYRNAPDLPAGAVLVVGSGQSGVQIAEDLLEAGREVYLATSRVGRFRRRYRGRDIFEWLLDVGWFEQTVADLADPVIQFAPQGLISGLGRWGHTVSLQWLGERGVRLLGRATGVADGRITFADDLAGNVAWADERSADVNAFIERGIAGQGLDAPPLEDDPADAIHPAPGLLRAPTTLDLDDAGISTVIWTTGVRGDWSWLPRAFVGPDGRPAHTDGVTGVPGLFVIGLPWLRNRASGILPGVGPDAAYLAERITAHLAAE